jgi:hypothetical protein
MSAVRHERNQLVTMLTQEVHGGPRDRYLATPGIEEQAQPLVTPEVTQVAGESRNLVLRDLSFEIRSISCHVAQHGISKLGL